MSGFPLRVIMDGGTIVADEPRRVNALAPRTPAVPFLMPATADRSADAAAGRRRQPAPESARLSASPRHTAVPRST